MSEEETVAITLITIPNGMAIAKALEEKTLKSKFLIFQLLQK
jgi:hypothetical protein